MWHDRSLTVDPHSTNYGAKISVGANACFRQSSQTLPYNPVCMRANRAMRHLLPDGTSPRNADALPDELAQILGDGMRVVDDCLVVGKSDAVPHLDSVRAAVMDKTGYECFVNHVHLKERGDSTVVLGHAVAFCKRVSAEAISVAPGRLFRFIISKNGNDWTVHFHTLRPNESRRVSTTLRHMISEFTEV
jgi:hypothetical protein